MKRNEKMLRKVFEANMNTSFPRATKSERIITTPEAPIYSPVTTNLTIGIASLGDTEKCCPESIKKDVTLQTLLLIDSERIVTTPEAPIYSPVTTNLTIGISSLGDTEKCCPESIKKDITLQTLLPIDSERIVTTPEAPIYSPVTTNLTIGISSLGDTEKCCPESIKKDVVLQTLLPIDSEEIVTTPEAPTYSPVTPIDRNIFLSGINAQILESRENSSPVPAMSPDTLKLFEILNYSDYSDDDSIKDPNYIPDKDLHSSPEHSHTLDTTQQPSERVGLVVSKPLKRRFSENDLQHIHQTQQPSKKLNRSASISGAISISQENSKSESPKKKKVSNPNKWKRHVEKDKRLKGLAYNTIKGKFVPAMPFKQPSCLAKAKHKCNNKVPEEARKKIYESFRSLGTLEAQRQFIIQHVRKEKKNRSTTNGPSRKESTHHYTFTIGHEKVCVCRDFFLDTLNVKEGIVRGALKKVSAEGVLLADKRGKKPPSNKLSAERLDFIKKHIFSFPAMESHYCRKNTEYKYLDSGLNIRIMYSLYMNKCEEVGTKPAGIETYRKVFRSYKLRFHVPKKDLCKKCIAYKEQKGNATFNSKDENHLKHLKRRDDAYLRRDADKAAAKENLNILAFNFDLEAVLQTPKAASGPFFYVRKLAVYNLTFYKFGDQDVDCFTWDETEGKRGSIQIATCVYKYISGKQGITYVRMMSDNCGGQQKNFNFSCMLLYLMTTHDTIQIIDHVFYESGHSHMECDSIHSKIEQKCKNSAVYTPDGWIQVMRLARMNPRPFNVNVLVHDDFLDFNPNQCQFVEETTRKQTQRKKCSHKRKMKNEQEENDQQDETKEKEKINFQDAVWIQYRKENPRSIFIKTDYNDESFKELKIKPKRGKTASIVPVPIYSERIPISKAKKRDLLKLCKDNQIPKYYHSFYENLPDSEIVQDRLPEPDAEEADEQ